MACGTEALYCSASACKRDGTLGVKLDAEDSSQTPLTSTGLEGVLRGERRTGARITIVMWAPSTIDGFSSTETVNPYNEIVESNESNNTATTSFSTY